VRLARPCPSPRSAFRLGGCALRARLRPASGAAPAMSGAATGLRQAFTQGAVVGLARRRELLTK